MACPACRREYPAGVQYCPHDARKLVPAADMVERTKSGAVCPRCRRAFDAGVRYCPHDAEELVPVALWEATAGKPEPPAGVVARMCPQCHARYDLAQTFCARDGAELVTIN
jgi:predicted amidophosphoribosyltransferase